jgi:hypothetical protein
LGLGRWQVKSHKIGREKMTTSLVSHSSSKGKTMKFLIRQFVVCLTGLWLCQMSYADTCGAFSVDDVLQAENLRLQSQIQNDTATLNQLLAEELVYIRNSAVVDDKTSYLDAIQKGDTVYESIDHMNDSVRVFGCTAILTGSGKYVVRIKQNHLTLQLRYHSVWHQKDGVLKMVSWQATRVPPPVTQ